jgi:TP901 family phage tail tape measure protein
MAKRIVDEEMRFSIIVNGDKAQKELYDLEKSTRDLTTRNKELRAEQAKMVSQGLKQSAGYKALTAELKNNNAEINRNKSRMKELQQQIGITGLTMNQLKKRATELRLQLLNMVPGSGQYKKYVNELKEVSAQMGKLKAQGAATRFSIGGLANGFNKYAALGASIIATVTGVVFSLQKLIDYNSKLSDAMSDVQKTTGLTKKEVDELSISFGLLQTRTSRIDLLKIAEEGGRIGIAKEEIGDFVEIMNKAVVALGDSFPGGAEETASKLGKLKLLFKETANQKVDKAYNAIGSAINELGANGVATEVNIANFATRVGSLPDALKPTIADALALGAAFEENGIQAEIAGRAYSILLGQAAEESEKFAEVMGVTNKEVQDLINDNPLDFLIEFAKGLKGMNATDTAKTLDYLGVSADGANKVLGALSNNTERFGELLELSNRSMREGTSLITEYNIKNNNFAAILDKVTKSMSDLFLKGAVARGIEYLIVKFADLFDIVDDVNEQFEKETQITFETAKANRNLAESSSKLLDEYESLTADGVEPTTEAKERLDEITLQLKDRLGDSVVAIDAETGALKLNTEAVREQIKLKRLSADEEAATLASRLKGAVDEQNRLRKLLPEKEKQAAAAVRASKAAQDEFNERLKRGEVKQSDYSEISEIKLSVKTRLELFNINKDIEEQEKRRIDLLEKLKELNFTEDDVNSFFAVPEVIAPATGGGGGGGGGGSFNIPGGDKQEREKNRKELLDYQRETEDARLELISDSFKKELEIQRVAHERKIQDLQSQKVTGVENATEINAEINKQIELQDQIHQLKVATIYEKGIQDRFQGAQDEYEAEKQRRQAEHNEVLASLGSNKKAREELDKQFKADELVREEAHLNKLLANLQELRDAGNFGGMDLSLLSDEDVKEIQGRIDQLKLDLSELGLAKSKLSGEGESKEDGPESKGSPIGDVDIFGFTAEQWGEVFNNLDTTENKIAAVQMAVIGMMNIWGQYSAMVQKQNDAEFRNFEKLQDKKFRSLQSNLDKGLVNQRQYDEGVRGLEEETARKKAELEYKQAKSEKEQAIANTIINTSVAIMQAYAQLGPIGGTIAAVLIGTLGALQLNAIRKTPLPAKGFEQGYYGDMPIKREQDGRVYNASYGGTPTTQMVDKPKYFLAGEGGKNFPEMIIDGRAFKQFNPDFKNALYREIARVKGYEGGYYQTQTSAPAFSGESSNGDSVLLLATLQRTNQLLEDLDRNGVQAYLVRNLKTAKEIREDIKSYEELKNKNRV